VLLRRYIFCRFIISAGMHRGSVEHFIIAAVRCTGVKLRITGMMDVETGYEEGWFVCMK
jgi:hypothetical protein